MPVGTRKGREQNMARQNRKIRVGVNGYGLIGKRVADAITQVSEMLWGNEA